MLRLNGRFQALSASSVPLVDRVPEEVNDVLVTADSSTWLTEPARMVFLIVSAAIRAGIVRNPQKRAWGKYVTPRPERGLAFQSCFE